MINPYKERVSRLQGLLQENNLDALLITSSANRTYLSGFTGSSGYVLITITQAVLFTDSRYVTQAGEQVAHMDIIEHEPKAIRTIAKALVDCGIQRLGFESAHVTYADYQAYANELNGIDLVPAVDMVEQLRMIKDEWELAILKEAAELADQTFSYILGVIKPGMKEREVALELETYMRKAGATGPSFETIVASGERSALPHGVASDKVIQSGEFVKLDFGAYYKGYCSDITRTVMVGKPTKKHKEIYEIVLEAQVHALEQIRPGMTGSEADALTRDIIKMYGYNDYFGHGTGHGIGLEIHEAPRLSQNSNTCLQTGMTVTVEPGIYLPGFGGVRIEDDIVITENGIERLTVSSKDFTVIDG